MTTRDRPEERVPIERAPRLHAVPALQHLWPRRDAALRARARGAPYRPRAGRGRIVPRARGGRGAAQRAGRDRTARRRADRCSRRSRGPLFALADAAVLALPRAPAGTPTPLLASVPAGAPRRSYARSPTRCRAARAAPRAQPPAHRRRPSRASSRRCARTRRLRSGRTGEQALANVCALIDLRAALEAPRATLVPRLRACSSRHDAEPGEAARGAGGGGGHRRRAHHDRAPRQGPRVSGRDPRRHDRAETPKEPSATSIRRAACARAARACTPRELLENADDEMQRDRDEAMRLPYVAATRARDLLVVPAVGNARHEGWLSAPQCRDLSRAKGLARANRAPCRPDVPYSATIASSCARPRLRPSRASSHRVSIAPRPAIIKLCGGIRRGSSSTRARRWACGRIGC